MFWKRHVNEAGRRLLRAFAHAHNMLGTDWIEVEGCIVAADHLSRPERTVRRMLAEGTARQDIERFANHHHLSMLVSCFQCDELAPEEEQAVLETYVALAEHRLRQRFPDRQFVTEIVEEEDDVTIMFYQAETPGQS